MLTVDGTTLRIPSIADHLRHTWRETKTPFTYRYSSFLSLLSSGPACRYMTT